MRQQSFSFIKSFKGDEEHFVDLDIKKTHQDFLLMRYDVET